MENKIRVLSFNKDQAGVNYFRSLTPAMEIEKNHSDEIFIEISNNLDFNDPATISYLKSFNIIHYHRQLVDDLRIMRSIALELKNAGVKLVVDIDDYWFLHKKHPFYSLSLERKMHIPILENLKIADYVTTTTDLFASEIKKVTKKDNVIVLYNSIDVDLMRQFQNNWKPDPDGLVRITYAAGSSHMGDIEQLEHVVNILSNDQQVKDKFKIIIAGWDADGTTTDIRFNQEFGNELQKIGLWTQKTVDIINKTRGDVDAIPSIPRELADKYRGSVFDISERPIRSEESVYFNYEKILTDNHKLIKDKNYLRWLMNFERNVKYENEGNFARRWTQKANVYAEVLNETDIVIAPLADNEFNRVKSNLKQVECWTRKLPIVCSDIPPYNVDGKHMENCILIPNEKNAKKYWVRYLKKLILDADLRKKLGEQLYEDFKDRYNLTTVTKKRVEFYKNILK